jgi:hypothetical protein
MLEIEDKVNHLDELMAQLIKTVERTSWEMRESHDRADERSRREMREFKEEMRESHERFAQEMRESHERLAQEMRASKKEADKRWGELTKKLGTIAEDLVAPSIPRILQQVIGCTEELDYLAIRVRKKKPRTQEFDVVALCGEYVFINETKNTLRSEYINNFYELMQNIHDYFPEFAGKKFIGAIASLYVEDTLVRQGERLGLIVLGFGEELMDVLNSPGFVPKQF